MRSFFCRKGECNEPSLLFVTRYTHPTYSESALRAVELRLVALLLIPRKFLGACNHPGHSEEHQPGGILFHMQPYGYPFAAVHTAV